MALSLDAFDARVLRANKSMDGLERLVDGSAERQAVAEMRREITALFVAQRRDLEMQQIRSATDVAGGENRPSVARADGLRMRDQGAARTIDPAIAAQQHAIAAGRAARAQCEQAEAAKVARQERQQEIRRQAAQGRQNDKDRDGPAR